MITPKRPLKFIAQPKRSLKEIIFSEPIVPVILIAIAVIIFFVIQANKAHGKDEMPAPPAIQTTAGLMDLDNSLNIKKTMLEERKARIEAQVKLLKLDYTNTVREYAQVLQQIQDLKGKTPEAGKGKAKAKGKK